MMHDALIAGLALVALAALAVALHARWVASRVRAHGVEQSDAAVKRATQLAREMIAVEANARKRLDNKATEALLKADLLASERKQEFAWLPEEPEKVIPAVPARWGLKPTEVSVPKAKGKAA